MRYSKFMIGDWVCFTNDYPDPRFRGVKTKITQIDGRLKTEATGSESIHPSYLEPISIDKDFLIQNGFVRVSENVWERENVDVLFYSDKKTIKIVYFVNEMTIPNYIHSFQHFLRLSDLEEMADSFNLDLKIESSIQTTQEVIKSLVAQNTDHILNIKDKSEMSDWLTSMLNTATAAAVSFEKQKHIGF